MGWGGALMHRSDFMIFANIHLRTFDTESQIGWRKRLHNTKPEDYIWELNHLWTSAFLAEAQRRDSILAPFLKAKRHETNKYMRDRRQEKVK